MVAVAVAIAITISTVAIFGISIAFCGSFYSSFNSVKSSNMVDSTPLTLKLDIAVIRCDQKGKKRGCTATHFNSVFSASFGVPLVQNGST